MTWIACGLASGLLAGCDTPYPDAWAPLAREALADLSSRCPDLGGSYRLPAAPAEEGEVSLGHTFLGQTPRWVTRQWRWETVTFSGDANTSLTVTLHRSPATMTAYRDSLERKGGEEARAYQFLFSPEGRQSAANAALSDQAYEEQLKSAYVWPVERVVLTKGRDYACYQGWIRSRRIADAGPGDRSGTASSRVNGEVLLGRDTDGYLVAKAIYRKPVTLALPCDGCPAFDVGIWNVSRWAHWSPGSPAWVGEVPRPWAAKVEPATAATSPADALPATTVPASAEGPVDVAARVRPLLPEGVLLGPVVAEGTRHRVTVFSDDAVTAQRFVRNVAASGHFDSPEVLSMETKSGRLQETVLRLSARAVP